MFIHSKKQAQIKTNAYINIQGQNKTQIRALIFHKTFNIILIKYSNYKNIFLAKNTAKLLKYTKINDHTIKLEENK